MATILSAQCTDHRVNIVTKDLFQKYRTPTDFAYCSVTDLAKDIHSCGYHNQKAKSIQGSSLKIVEEHDEIVPGNLNELVALPGVGRKTANCILGEIYNVPSMVIDHGRAVCIARRPQCGNCVLVDLCPSSSV